MSKPDTRETALLALELLKRMSKNRKVSAGELHDQLPEHLGRDLRTVQRQLDMLSAEFEIERDDSGKPYGYRWKERSAGRPCRCSPSRNRLSWRWPKRTCATCCRHTSCAP